MLKTLDIKDYAIIEHLRIDLKDGFCVMTGETGAGKSIIMGALGMVMGEKAEAKSVRNGAKKSIVEAVFAIKEYDLKDYFDENDLDYDDECTIRREVTENGKSRAFVNDTPITLSDLKNLGEKLIDIHSQHANLLLKKDSFQLKVIDTIAKDEKELSEYKSAYKTYKDTEKELRQKKEELEKNLTEKDYITFQLERLREANVKEDEEKELEQEQEALTYAGDTRAELETAWEAISDDEHGAENSVRTSITYAEKAAAHDNSLKELLDRLKSAYIELKDIGSELESRKENLEVNPERLELINERLDTIYTLEKKHGVDNTKDLLAKQAEIEEKVNLLETGDEEIKELEKRLESERKTAEEKAAALTDKRKAGAQNAEQETVRMLKELGMANVRFNVTITHKDSLEKDGADDMNFIFSANEKGAMQKIEEVASGGEIARVMLTLKAQMAASRQLPTIVFDEIDTGISGEVADKMGRIMKDMGSSMQVICITHLPQIASKGSNHYHVYKSDSTTKIDMLSETDRIKEIAQMLSGSGITEAAIENAKELLKG